MPKVVKEVRRFGEAYDVVRLDNGRFEKRPVDVAASKPKAKKASEDPPASSEPNTDPSA